MFASTALGSKVACIGREGGLRKPAVREHEALDARRGDRLGAEELAGERLEVDQRGRVFVQVAARLLGIRGGSRDV